MQWRKDTMRILRSHRIAIFLTFFVVVVGVLLCALVQPEPRADCVVFVN